VTEDGEQTQTVGHHFNLSRPLNQEERIHMERGNVCVACHQELPEGTLATSLLHHVADAIHMLPKSNEQHSDLVHKTVLVAAWAQVGGAFVGGFVSLLVIFAFLRWRRRRKRARA
jgi:hypothetical protein